MESGQFSQELDYKRKKTSRKPREYCSRLILKLQERVTLWKQNKFSSCKDNLKKKGFWTNLQPSLSRTEKKSHSMQCRGQLRGFLSLTHQQLSSWGLVSKYQSSQCSSLQKVLLIRKSIAYTSKRFLEKLSSRHGFFKLYYHWRYKWIYIAP